MLNPAKLRAVMAEQCVTQTMLASKIGVSKQTLSAKMTGKSSLTLDEIDHICLALNITDGATKESIFLAKPFHY